MLASVDEMVEAELQNDIATLHSFNNACYSSKCRMWSQHPSIYHLHVCSPLPENVTFNFILSTVWTTYPLRAHDTNFLIVCSADWTNGRLHIFQTLVPSQRAQVFI